MSQKVSVIAVELYDNSAKKMGESKSYIVFLCQVQKQTYQKHSICNGMLRHVNVVFYKCMNEHVAILRLK